MINYRALFDEARIHWIDRGANTSRGEINIQCPWCGNEDPSEHLSINETSGAYYCRRSGRQHYGISVWKLLSQLKVPYTEAQLLVKRHSMGEPPPVFRTPEPEPGALRWDQYPPAHQSAEALDYLAGRGFEEPEQVARSADLRVCEEGRLARRILLPVTNGKQIYTYTARAMHARIVPKYLAHPACSGGVYTPIEPRAERNLYLIEGPFDALKLWASTGESSAALMGLALPPARLKRLQPLIEQAKRTYLVLDGDQTNITAGVMRANLSLGLVKGRVTPIRGPAGYKDIGEAPAGEIRRWMDGQSNSGMNSG